MGAARLSPLLRRRFEFVFTDNETNNERLFGAKNTAARTSRMPSTTIIVHGKTDAVNPAGSGTKARPIYRPHRLRPAKPRRSGCRLTELLATGRRLAPHTRRLFHERIAEKPMIFTKL